MLIVGERLRRMPPRQDRIHRRRLRLGVRFMGMLDPASGFVYYLFK